MINYFVLKTDVLTVFKEVFEIAGIAIIFYGGVRSILAYIIATCKGKSVVERFWQFRTELGQSIISGLELLVAADVISTLMSVTYDKLGIIFILIILRTLLSYVLMHEVKTVKKTEKSFPKNL
ncbi:hypothetical protein A3F06_00455 [candidate division TM6 bacterium RIFCSPHIGHO2_12_FULL_36_22]|nr:MAG: hypothetical protein A3F06_00455 [candidate division TM6 bacterium RIFCSPHIGHO2_12_FULL_36_22]